MNFRDRILNSPDVKTVPVDVPEWGGTYYARTLDGHGRAAMLHQYQRLTKADAIGELAVWAVVYGLADDQGARIFQDADAPAVAAKNGEVLERVASAILRHNGLDGADQGNG